MWLHKPHTVYNSNSYASIRFTQICGKSLYYRLVQGVFGNQENFERSWKSARINKSLYWNRPTPTFNTSSHTCTHTSSDKSPFRASERDRSLVLGQGKNLSICWWAVTQMQAISQINGINWFSSLASRGTVLFIWSNTRKMINLSRERLVTVNLAGCVIN